MLYSGRTRGQRNGKVRFSFWKEDLIVGMFNLLLPFIYTHLGYFLSLQWPMVHFGSGAVEQLSSKLESMDWCLLAYLSINYHYASLINFNWFN